jgi:hypothetical protein
MRRRSRTRGRNVPRKSHTMRKAVRRRGPSFPDRKSKVARLTRELDEAREQKTECRKCCEICDPAASPTGSCRTGSAICSSDRSDGGPTRAVGLSGFLPGSFPGARIGNFHASLALVSETGT